MSRMSLEQKIGQLWQKNFWGDTIRPMYRDWIRNEQVGSFFNAKPELRNELQRVAVEEPPLGIPLIFGRDVIHGYRTLFPIPIGQSCNWNPGLVKQAAAIAAKEAATQGIDWTFAPMIDMTRNPRWGRVAETCGEDAFLTAHFAKAMVEGFQGDKLADSFTVAACAKHLAGYGLTEDGRDYNTTWIPRTLMRNYILPPFQAAMEAEVATVMSSFNDINGVPASGCEWLFQTLLREEWQYDGMVVSDRASVTEMNPTVLRKTKKKPP